MARFHPLRVTALRKTTRDAVELTLFPEDGADFSFTQGQYLTFRQEMDGVEIRRSYSISAATGDALQVGIKAVEGGAFSTWANTELAVGDTLHAMPPAGRFHAPLKPQAARHYLLVAGGSGITPILSILRTVLRDEPQARVTLIYANRNLPSIMFREEIEDLKNQHMGRVSVLHMLESGAEIDLFSGRLTAEKCAALFASWVQVSSIDLAFICGPLPMMETVRDALQAEGMDESAIKVELFKSAQPGRLERPASAKAAETEGTDVTLEIDGSTHHFTMRADQSLLDAAIAQGIDAPYSCTAGVCSTCMCRVHEGEVEMAANHALEDYEVKRGYVLSCQSFAVKGPLKVAFEV